MPNDSDVAEHFVPDLPAALIAIVDIVRRIKNGDSEKIDDAELLEIERFAERLAGA